MRIPRLSTGLTTKTGDSAYEYCCEDVEIERERTSNCGRCRRRSSSCGCWTCALMPAAFCIDRDLAAAARAIAQAAAPELNAELAQLTGGAVTSINQVARLKLWLAQQGCIADTLEKAAIENLLAADNLPPAVRARWSSARVVPRLPPRRLMPCSLAVTAMAAFAAPCATTAPAQVAGPAMGCSLKT